MQKKIVGIIIFILVFTTFAGAMSSQNTPTEKIENEAVNTAYHNNALVEYGTYTTCIYCKYGHEALIYLFKRGDLPFYYVVHVYDVSTHAYGRVKTELGLTGSPTAYWDGGWRSDEGSPSNATAQGYYKKSIFKCENRTVKDIDLDLDVKWLGAVNNHPEDGETKVPIGKILTWTSSEMLVNVSVKNNEASQHNAHLHVYVCDVKSSMGWYDTAPRLYSMTFLDYAFNENLALGAGTTWEGSKKWDGTNHTNGSHFFKYVTQDNTMVVASIFDRDNEDYSDETTGVRVGLNTDPKTYTLYMGNTTPPPLVIDNISVKYFYNGTLDWNTTYYWRVDEWNQKDERILGKIWNFTTRDNNPPNTPDNEYPWNTTSDVPIKINLSWDCDDPEDDNITYDVYLGKYNPPFINLSLIAENINVTWYEVEDLDFEQAYAWQIVAKDEWDEQFGNYNTTGPIWLFTTEANIPPNKASNPVPSNGSNNIPTNLTLRWNGTDPNYGDTLTYDVYFDDAFPLTLRKEKQAENYYDPYPPMQYPKTYYWKIDTYDREGLMTEGDIWTFNTGLNYPPIIDNIDGPTQGKPGLEYEFTFIAIDPENDSVCYKIDWDDGTITDWTDLQTHGPPGYSENHSYSEEKTFVIEVRAKDNYGNVGPKKTFTFIAPKNNPFNINLFFLKFLENHPNLFPLLRHVIGI